MKFPVLLGIAYAVGSAAPGAASAGLRGGGGRSLEARLLEGAVAGTYLFADVQYEPGTDSTGLPEETDNIELEDGTILELTDCFPPGLAKKQYASGSDPIALPKGTTLANGKANCHGNRPIVPPGQQGRSPSLFDRDLAEERTPEQERNLAELRRNLAVVGTKTVLAVKIIVSDGAYAYTEDVLRDEVFGQNADGSSEPANDQVNLRTQYARCSHDKLIFNPVGDRNISGPTQGNLSTNISNGVVTVHLPGSTVSQGDGNIRNLVNTELKNMFGVSSAANLANHVMHCMPQEAMSGIAYAYVNSWNSVYKNQWCNYPSGQMHEIGHNIGLAHSNEAGAYKDQTGFMGYSYSSDEQKMCFNNAKIWQLGWFSDQDLDLAPGSDWSGTITSHINYNDGNGGPPVVIRLGDVFIGFNWDTSYNSATNEGRDQVTIQEYTGSYSGSGYSGSELLHKLGVDASTTITGTSDTITVDAIDTATGTAVITINNGGGPTGPGPQESPPSDPPPTNAPTQPPTPPPTPPPTTPAPTNPPTTPFPTSPPTTPPPTPAPTPQPTQAPTTANPTSSPTTAPPTPAPTPPPTNPPTFAPVQKYICAGNGDGLTTPQICDGGSPLDGTCGAGDAGSSTAGCTGQGKKCQIATCSSSGPSPTPAPQEPTPSPPTDPAPTPPEPSPSPPTGCGTKTKKQSCSANNDCASCSCNLQKGWCSG